MKLKDVLSIIPDYSYVIVEKDMPVDKLKELVRKQHGIRSIYVTDKNGKVLGEISMGALIKNVTAVRRCKSRINPRELLSCIIPNRAGDIMDRRLVYAKPDEDVEDVLDRCIKYNIKEMPVLDEKGNLVKNVGVLDLVKVLEDKVNV